jgi:hypothetical protein
MLGVEIEKARPLRPQQVAGVQVERKADPSPDRRQFTMASIPNRVAAFARRFVTSGPAQVDSPNDWNGLPQYGMEVRAANETLHEMFAQSGEIVLDLNIANSFHVEMSGPGYLRIAEPLPLPAGQPFRARSFIINVIVYRNGQPMGFANDIMFSKGEATFEGGDGPDDLSFKVNVGTGGVRRYGYLTGEDFGLVSA